MATPKFDKISLNLATAIGDPVSAVADDGVVLSAAQRNLYVNEALEKLFTEGLASIKEKEVLIGVFPELYQRRTVTCTKVGSDVYYSIASPNYDIYQVISAYGLATNKHFQIIAKEKYSIIKSGVHPHYVFTATNPVLIHFYDTIYLFPSSITETTYQVDIYVIVKPINPSTGGHLAQGGSYDIPYDEIWIPKISEIAEQLYRIDSQETT